MQPMPLCDDVNNGDGKLGRAKWGLNRLTFIHVGTCTCSYSSLLKFYYAVLNLQLSPPCILKCKVKVVKVPKQEGVYVLCRV